MNAAHFVSVSGGKDSTAVMCLARERMGRRAGFAPRFVFADTGNEHQITLDHIAYLAQALEVEVETVRADFTHLFDARREAIRRDWPNERRRREHLAACEREGPCDCPVLVSPPVPPEVIEAACAALQPSGNPFLDMCLLKGRFPGARTRFCTDLLKLVPMDQLKLPLMRAGRSVVEWIGERAEESQARAGKARLQRYRPFADATSWRVLYRPIHALKHREVFEIAKRHGLRPNPLYLMGMGRVGCWPCILEKKKGVRVISQRTPETIDRLEDWEERVGRVSRRGGATFFCAKMIPGDGDGRAHIKAVVEWSRTSLGGRNFDLFLMDEMMAYDRDGLGCDSEYGLCE